MEAFDVAASVRRPRGRPGYDRETVLRRAIDLFNARGYDATSMSDLAAELGVGKSALYHHFEGKEALLSAALDEALDAISSALEQATAATSAGSAHDRLRAAVESAVLILAAHLPAVTLLLRVRGNTDIELAALERRRHIDDQLAALVKEAQAEGSIRADLDPDVTSRLAFGLVNSLTDWFRPDGPMPPDELARAITGILFDGLARP
jgi:AcrR family transcriptional regulator